VTISGETGWRTETASIITNCAPQPVQQSGEARIRYIIADTQLGNVADYYRPLTGSDADIAEAVRRWDAGIRVKNIDQFERKVINGNWQVVYMGTSTTVNGMDVILTNPVSYACNNPYWPIELGAEWIFDGEGSNTGLGYSTYSETWKVTNIEEGQIGTSIEISIDKSEGISSKRYFSCTPGNGILSYIPQSDAPANLFLPSENDVAAGYQWQGSDNNPEGGNIGMTVSVVEFPTITVPYGTFSTVHIQTAYPNPFSSTNPNTEDVYFARSVGPVLIQENLSLGGEAGQSNTLKLSGYHSPSSGNSLNPGDTSATTYTIQPGDTIGMIAIRFGVTLQAIVAANGNMNPDSIYVGQVLVIPAH
jgi:hypothetical protein